MADPCKTNQHTSFAYVHECRCIDVHVFHHDMCHKHVVQDRLSHNETVPSQNTLPGIQSSLPEPIYEYSGTSAVLEPIGPHLWPAAIWPGHIVVAAVPCLHC